MRNISTNTIKAAVIASLLLMCQFPEAYAAEANPSNPKMDKTTFEKPDFAFPESVEKDAYPVFKKALEGKNSIVALKAAIQIAISRNLISTSSFNENVEMFDSLAKVLPNPYSSLAYLLEASLYKSLYISQSWIYNQRALPTDSFPEDPLTWSGDLFAKKILNLVEMASGDFEVAKKIPLKDITGVLSDYDSAVKAGLYVYDFIVYKGMDLLNGFGGGFSSKVIPFRAGYYKSTLSIPEQCQKERVKLMDDLYSYRVKADHIPALVFAILEKCSAMETGEKRTFLKGWFSKLNKSPERYLLLNSYYECVRNGDFVGSKESKDLYSQMQSWLQEFPKSEGVSLIKYDIAAISQPTAQLTISNIQLPQTGDKGKIVLKNMNQCYVLIYKVPESIVSGYSVNMNKFPGGAKLIKAIPVTAAGDTPFKAECSFEIPGLPAGMYVALPSTTPTLSSDWKKKLDIWSVSAFRVTDVSIISTSNSNERDSSIIYVVDSRNQQPIAGVEVIVYSNDGKNRVVKVGKTDSHGAFVVPEGYYRIKVRNGGAVTEDWYGYNYYKSEVDTTRYVNILTDLSIYRPGNRVQFSVVGWSQFKGDNRLMRNEKIRIELRDANYNIVDSLRLQTDDFGRCHGSFVLPESGLLGSYSLNAAFVSYENWNAGTARFQVAEYKTPGFLVELDKDSTQTYAAGDILRFKGAVKTYSDMPLGGAAISFKVSWSPWWRIWSGSNPNASYGGELFADENGQFVIELPTENLKGTEFENGIYTLSVSAVSNSGETESASDLRFSLGKDFMINPEIADNIKISGDSVKLHIPVVDMLGLPTIKKVDYLIENLSDSRVIAKGVFDSPSLSLPSSQFQSGRYRFTFNLSGDTVKTVLESVVWRENDNRAPYATSLWVPEKNIVVEEGSSTVNVKVGSGYPGSWILCVVTDEKGIQRREWIKIEEMNQEVKVKAPENNGRVWVTFSGMHDFMQKVETVTVFTEKSTEQLAVKAESFRNKISSGEMEIWKFHFAIKEKEISSLPAFAVMSDKALNALAPFSWSFSPSRGYFRNATAVSTFLPSLITTTGRYSTLPKYTGISYVVPDWQTYGYGFVSSNSRIRGLRKSASNGIMVSGSQATISTDYVVDEMKVEAEAPMFASASMKLAAAAAVEESSVTVKDPGEADNRKQEELRPVEMPLAFFMPDLLSDGDGNVTVEFEVPDFNTTWQFQILGYTPELLTAGLTLDAVASKKVMVKSNPPRYLRTGDKAQISALLFNNSEDDIKLGGKLQLLNPDTGEELAVTSLDEGVTAPSANRVISLCFDVPPDLDAVVLRAYAESDTHSDGEQTIIPILPSSTPVVESTQFYMGAGENSITRKLPKYEKNANVTLKYCDNPIWECVLALPSLSMPQSDNLLSQMQALYANAMARGIVERYPRIKTGIGKLFAAKEAGDSTVLQSNLKKDSNFKIVALNNTPWVNNAASETTRLSQLNTLLDSVRCEGAIASLLERVGSLQNKDGGWSWCKGMKSSLFMTEKALSMFAMMSRNGYLPAGGNKMIRSAVKYCDKTIYDDYLKSDKNFSAESMLSYLLDRSCFAVGEGSSGFADLKTQALKKISEDWRHFTIYQKASAAILLSRSKGYERTAGIILESLNQLASKSDSKGWWFDNLTSGYNGWSKLSATSKALEAYAEIEPKSEAVDGLRQWLILQKETEDWGNNSSTVEVIQSILSSGSEWTSSSSAPVITVGGKNISIPSQDILTGSMTITLDPAKVSGKEIRIEKSSDGPSWGGVVSQVVSPIKEVKAESCENLKIEKQLLVVRNTSAGEVATEGTVKVGDKVRVTLTLTCDKDMNYVALTDERGACLEPADQLSGYSVTDGLASYREVRDSKTSFFIEFLPKGVNVISYDCYVDREGTFSIGIASVQCQYSPLQTAHSKGQTLTVYAR